ncbi:four helix bundle protein [Terriglobus sp. RCC_193]|uniref:four helix bundle protein n=1 Tax=Terriglobus sp. RCC_193 TaxID=3239218 RepID=UPI0035238449
MGKSFRELEVWQRSMELATAIYRVTEGFPRHETYGLSSQMRRCAVSIPSNIAEGSARATKRDFSHFITIARGSAAELETQLDIARRLGYVDQSNYESVEALCFRVSRMLTKLLEAMRNADSRAEREQRLTRATR